VSTRRHHRAARAGFIITLVRSFLALALGLGLLLGVSRAPYLLGNTIGLYILSSALLTLRWWLAYDRKTVLTGLASILGITTGVAILGRGQLARTMPPDAALQVVGMLALLTGWTRVLGGFAPSATEHPLRSLERFVLGGFEVLLGVLLVIFPSWVEAPERFPPLSGALVGWSLIGGLTLLADAMRRRIELRTLEEKSPLTEPGPDAGGRGQTR
jgi:hypothetical protein